MNLSFTTLALALFSIGLLPVSIPGDSGMSAAEPLAKGGLTYPVAKRVDQVDLYHGVKVADPFRWLESSDSSETRQWIERENAVTYQFLDHIPARPKIRQRLTELWNYERYGVPFKKGGRYFYTKNDGLQNQSVLYTLKTLGKEPHLLLDPNTLSQDGTVALSTYALSDDGKWMAYALATADSDWTEFKVRNVDTGQDLEDHLKWIKFSGAAWTHDHQGFFYSRFDEPKDANALTAVNYFQKLFYHKLGTPQAADQLVYERPDQKEWEFSSVVSEDGRYLVIHVHQGTDVRNRVYYKDLQSPQAKVVPLLDNFDAEYDFVGNQGSIFWFKTNLDAPRRKIIDVDLAQPARSHWRTVVPQAEETLEDADLLNHSFVVRYLQHARHVVRIFTLEGKSLREVQLPGIGAVAGFSGRENDRETFYSFASFTMPATIYRYDLESDKTSIFHQPQVKFKPADYETRQVFYRSKDGTRIPMFITCRKGLPLNGENPAYLYGYGGFNISLVPAFSVSNLVWMEMGGVYAVPNLRGGGEYGEAWHQAGTKLKKQNVFDDFIAAAEWLIAHRYTSTGKLAIGGGSNGGLLVGAAMTQRPELFGAACPDVGVMDMLRYHKFTIGWGWASDFGSSENSREFKALYAYSPLHNIKPGTSYPATLVTTADHDDRVVPGHSFKFAASLQAAQKGTAPALIRIENKAGHGAGKPTSKMIDLVTDRWSFLFQTLRMKTDWKPAQ
jgi:prolyl oligopeptidase